ncbi:MAG: adenylate kinase family protein [Methanobacteriaceae archaeon]|nr:adenylate kinase family protein [Methanobacteriaceae archaeon]
MTSENKIIFITGTPCVGKTTIASNLVDNLSNDFNTKLIKINDLAIENNLILGEDVDKGYKIVDIPSLNESLNKVMKDFFNLKMENNNPKLIIVEGHLSHFCSNCDKCIVLRLNPLILKKRLESRKYKESKVNENLEAEALSVCSVEAFENHGEHVDEIDTTNKSIENVINIIKDIILNDTHFPVGNVDFMQWILENE